MSVESFHRVATLPRRVAHLHEPILTPRSALNPRWCGSHAFPCLQCCSPFLPSLTAACLVLLSLHSLPSPFALAGLASLAHLHSPPGRVWRPRLAPNSRSATARARSRHALSLNARLPPLRPRRRRPSSRAHLFIFPPALSSTPRSPAT